MQVLLLDFNSKFKFRRAIYFIYPETLEVLIKGIVKKSTTDVILHARFRRIMAMKEIFAQIMEVSVSLLEYLYTPNPRDVQWFVCLKFYPLSWILEE